MAVTFYDLNSDTGVKKLDDYLLTRSYITGYQASKDDITVYAAISKPPSSEYVNASGWYNHTDALLRICGVSAEGSGVIVEGSAPIATPPVDDTKAAAADDDNDDVDLFGEETEEEKKAADERSTGIKASAKKKESKLVPVGYGIKKLQIMLTIVDDLVSVDNLIEKHLMAEPVNEYVQSWDIVDFNKI